MRRTLATTALAGLAATALAACSSGGGGVLPPTASFGPHPQLPEPHHDLLPVVNIAKAEGWPAGGAPTPAPGFAVSAFANHLNHPRWLLVLPNGDVLVAETNGPKEKPKGLVAKITASIMDSAGAGVASPNRIILLRDADGDGVAETRSVFISGLNSPFGMALSGHDLYVANTDAVLRFPYVDGATSITAPGVKVMDLPAFPIDHHWTKNIIISPDGGTLFATVGSNSNVAESGMAVEEGRAAIWSLDLASGKAQIFATGLRNPNGMDFQPQTGALWTAVNERDELGNDLVPDYMTAVKPGAFYGWPYSYYGQHVDARVKPQRPDLVARATVPDYALGAHTASLGLTFYRGSALPARYAGGAFVGQHGSWNRSVRSGYQVIFVPFADGYPSGPPEPVLTGFINAAGHANGRPVGVAVDRSGALLVADDVGDTVWRVRASGAVTASAR